MRRIGWGKTGAGEMQNRKLFRHGRTTLGFAMLLALGALCAGALGGSGLAFPLGSSGSASTDTGLSFLAVGPTISSDKEDYNPGNTVTLTGHNWEPLEEVHVLVNDDVGQTWSYSDNVTADSGGDFTLQFQLPTTFIATYLVTATGLVSGTATTSFTDGNLTFHIPNLVGVPGKVNVAYQDFTPAANCTGTFSNQSKDINIPGTASVGVGNNESIKVGAVTNSGAFVLYSWTTGNNSTDSGNPVGGDPNPCISGQAGGSNGNVSDLYAHFTRPPTVAADNATRTVNEGIQATNTGTWSDADTGDTVTLSASVGTVTKNAAGTWSWSFDTTDGPAQTQSVTITANDGHVSRQTSFQLNVNNVAPTGTFSSGGAVNEGSAVTVSFSGQSDPSSVDSTAGFHYAYSCTNGDLSAATYAGSGSSSSTTCTFDDGPATKTVKARIIDKDGGFTEYTTSVTVNNVAPSAALGNSGPVNEASPVTVTFSGQSDPSAADTSAGFHYAFSCSNGDLSGATYAGSGTSASTTCTFDDGPDTKTVKARIIDKDGGFTERTTSVVVNNVNPTATLSNNGPINEGGSATVSFSAASDPSTPDTSAGFHYAFSCSNGDLSGATYAGSGTTASTTCAFDDGPATKTVKARIIDKDGGFTEYSTSVVVNNVKPTATLSNNGPVAEGSPVTISFTGQSDPSTADTSAGFRYAYSCTNGSLASATYAGSGASASNSCTFSDNGTYTVRARIIDKDDGFSEYTTSVSVTNVAPAVTTTNQSSFEGSASSFHLGSFSDPGVNDNPWKVHVDWGDGSSEDLTDFDTQGSLGDSNHNYGDSRSTPYTVTVTVKDKDGDSGSSTFEVEVINLPPTATLSNNGPVNEGSPATISFSDQLDASSADTTAGFQYSYACDGNASSLATTYAGAPDGATKQCTFADNGSYTVKARIFDKDDGYNEYTTTVTVNNVAPTATLSNDGPIDEGSSATISFSNQFDPSSVDTAAGLHYSYACDGQTSTLASTYGTALMPASSTCTLDDNGTYPVKGRIFDKDGGFNDYSTSVVVENVDPTATLSNNGPINEGSSATISFSAQNDPSTADTSAGFHYAYSCTNGSLAGSNYGNSGTSDSTSCSFDDNGSYTVKGRIIDKDNGFTEYTTSVTVNNVKPTATLSNNGPVNEGSPATIAFSNQFDPSSADTAAGFHYAFSCTNGDLSTETYAGSGSSASKSCTFDDNGIYTVKGRIYDKDGGFTEYTTAVTVDNVAPTATLANDGPVDEGSSATVSFSGALDPSTADTAAGFHYAFSCSNGDLSGATYAGSATSAFTSCSFDDNGSYTVKGRIIDKDDGYTQYTTTVTVENVDPTGTLANNGPVNEGTSATISFSDQSDPSTVDTAAGFHYAFSCSNGDLSGATYASSGTSSSTTCPFDDGPATKTIKARIIDKDDGFSQYTTDVTVKNVNPTASLANDGPIDEGSTAAISFSGASDASSADTTAGFHYAFSCSNGDLSGATYAGSGTSASTSCMFNDNGTSPVKGRIIDKDDGFTEYTTNVTVRNVAPTAVISNNSPVSEGSAATIAFSSQFDPSSADASAGFHYAYSCSNGSLAGATYSGSGSSDSTTCTYDDGPSTHTVRARIIDKDDGFTEYITTVTVNNADPTASLANNGPVGEGSPATISFSAQHDASSADTTAGFHYAYSCSNGDLSGETYAGSGTSASTSCTYDDGPSTHTVRARIIDKDGGFTEYTTSVTVNNVKPTATLSNNGPVDEGSPATVSFSAQSDPSNADTAAGFHYAYSCSNGDLSGATYAGSGTNTSTTCTFDDNGIKTVKARIIDKDGGFSEYTTNVTVENADPTAVAADDQSSDEGENHSFDLGTFSDPGTNDDPWSVHVVWGDGHSSDPADRSTQGSLGSASHSYGDNGTYTVEVTVTDKDGGSDSASFEVTVANVAPTASLANNGPVGEGSPATISFSAQHDASSADTTAGFHYAYSCSNGDLSGETYAGSGTSASTSCTYDDGPSTHTVRARIIDKDGGFSEYTTSVTVNNVKPTATLSNNGPVDEGSPATVSFSAQSDPSNADTAAGFHYAYSCTNASLSGSTYAGSGTAASTSCTYPDNVGSPYTVRARIIDKDGGYTEYTTNVTVRNVTPSVTAAANQAADEGTSKSFNLGSFSDPGTNDGPWAVDVDWGDPSTHTTFNATSTGTLAAQSHTYADNGTKTVTVKVTDKDGGSGQATFQVTVANIAPTITSFSGTTSLSGPLVFYPATFNGTFTDPGRIDNPWTANWSWDGAADPLATQTYPANGTDAHNFTQTHQYTTAGCSHTATVKITDKDGLWDTKTTTVDVGTGGFLPPMTNQPVTNKLKNGQVLPVKIQITNCSGVGQNNLVPAIRLGAGDQTATPDDAVVAITIPTSVSNADTTGVMRSSGSDGSYIYNMNINIPLNTDYTVVIYPYGNGSPVGPTLRHVIQATK